MRLKPAPFFVVRTPLLASDAFAAEPGAPLAARVEALRAFIGQPAIRRALAAASPSLVRALEAPRRSKDDEQGVLAAAMRYVERMRGRATPFALCAGYSLGVTARTSSRIELEPQERYLCVYRLDLDVVDRATTATLHRDTTLVVSRSVLVLGDVLKIASRDAAGAVTYFEVPRTDAVDALLARAASGASPPELAATLLPFASDASEAEAIVAKAITLGLLVSAAAPSVATDDELASLGESEYADVAETARSIRCTSLTTDIGPAIASIERRLDLARRDALGIHDLLKPIARGALGDDVVRELARVVPAVRALGRRTADGRFRRLRDYLRSHFESREIPLVEALDPARGFDFPSAPEYDPPKQDEHDALRLALYTEAIRTGAHAVALDAARVAPTRDEATQSPFAVRFRLATTPDGPAIHDPLLLREPGTQFFARATAFSPELRDHVREHLRAHAAIHPDEDVAGLTYFVPGKSAAFVQFPSLQPFELVLTTAGGADERQRIDVNDLLVGVRGGRIVLRSKKTGRRVRVRPEGAANPDRPSFSSVARFLSVLAREEPESVAFHWGALASAPRLPRVELGRHVLVGAIWNIDRRETEAFRRARDPDAIFARAQELRARLALPRRIVFREKADHHLPIDLDDPLSVYAWHAIAEEQISVAEAFPAEASFVEGPEGRFHHEIVLPFLPSRAPAPRASTPHRHFEMHEVFDRVMPGGHVLYLKLYGDRDALISLITDVLRDELVDAIDAGVASHWFFLPYADPDPHLRLRLFGAPEGLFGTLLRRLRARLERSLQTRALHRLVLDTYERETTRYGGAVGMDLAERIFWASSEAAVLFHDDEPFRSHDDEAVVVRLVHSHLALLETMGLAIPDARQQVALAVARYQRAPDPMEPRRKSGELFRELRGRLLDAPSAETLFGSETSDRFREGFAALRARAGEISATFGELASDLMHVHTIRHLTPWYETPYMEELIYLIVEKCLAYRAFSLASPDRRNTL